MIIGDENVLTGVSSGPYEWETLEDACRIASEEFKVDMIEFSHRGTDEIRKKSFEWHNLDEIQKIAGIYQGKISFSIHSWLNILGKEINIVVEKLKQTALFAGRSGSKYTILHLRGHDEREKGIEILQNIFEQTIKYFEPGCVAAVENHYPGYYGPENKIGASTEDFLRIIEYIKSPNLVFSLDYGHAHMCGNTYEFIEKLSPFLGYTHIGDNFGRKDEHLFFGEGGIDWISALSRTFSSGFKGPFIAEYPVNVQTVSRLRHGLREILLPRASGRDRITN